jgi:phage-related protein
MPFLLPDLAALAAALLCFIAAVALSYIVKAIASALPNLSILGVGLNLAKIFRNAGDDIVGWVVDNTKSLWHDLATWVNGHAYLLTELGGAIVQAVTHLGDQIAHLFTSVIPHAITKAVGDAATYTDHAISTVEGDIAKARRILEADLSRVGRAAYEKAAAGIADIDRHIAAVVSYGVDHAEAFATREIHTLRTYVDHEISDAETYAKGLVDDLSRTIGKEITTLTNTVGADFAAAKAQAQTDATQALNTAKGLINDAITTTENVAQADANAVQTTLQKAIDAVSSTVTTLTGTVSSDFTAAETYATQQVAAGLTDVQEVLTGTAVTVGGAIGQAATAVGTTVGTDITDIQNTVTGALGAAADTVNGALEDIYQDLTGQAAAAGGDLTSLAGLVAGAITASIAGVVARVATLEKCSVGVCEDSPNNFSNLLQTALGLVDLAAVAPFLADIIEHPAAAEQEYAGLIGGAVQGGESVFESILNLAP